MELMWINYCNLFITFCILVDDEGNYDLYDKITRVDIFSILSLFKMDKSLGLDGWCVEFFERFFDLIGDDLLWVVEEILQNGKIMSSVNATFIVIIHKKDCPGSFN